MGNHSLRFHTFSLGILCLLIVFIGCGDNEIPALENRGYVYMGLVIPRSGPVAENGETIIRGADLAVEAINAKGGIRNRPVKLLIRDEMDYTTDSGFGGLAKDPRISVTIGHLLESAFGAARVPYLEAGHPVLLPFLSGDDVSRSGSGLFFRLIASDSDQARGLAQYARDTLKAEKYLIVRAKSAYSLRLAQAFSIATGHKDAETVVVELLPDRGGEAIELMQKIKKFQPDVVFLAVNGRPALSLIEAMAENKIQTTIMGTQALGSADVVSFLSRLTASAYLSLPLDQNSASPEYTDFHEQFQEKYHLPPNWLAILARDAVFLAAEAISRANDRPESIRNQLAGMNSEKKAFHGLSGSLHFVPEGRGITPVTVVKVNPALMNYLP